jgi:hypothetical protein
MCTVVCVMCVCVCVCVYVCVVCVWMVESCHFTIIKTARGKEQTPRVQSNSTGTCTCKCCTYTTQCKIKMALDNKNQSQPKLYQAPLKTLPGSASISPVEAAVTLLGREAQRAHVGLEQLGNFQHIASHSQSRTTTANAAVPDCEPDPEPERELGPEPEPEPQPVIVVLKVPFSRASAGVAPDPEWNSTMDSALRIAVESSMFDATVLTGSGTRRIPSQRVNCRYLAVSIFSTLSDVTV